MSKIRLTENQLHRVIKESVKKILRENDELEMAGKKGMFANKTYWNGIKGVQFIWHGAWSDPEIKYHGRLYNYYDLEDCLLSSYREDNPENKNDEGFDEWAAANPDKVKATLDEISPIE